MNNKNGTVIIQLEAGGPANTGTSVPKRKTESATNSNKAQRNVKVMSGNNIVESATLQYDTQDVPKKQTFISPDEPQRANSNIYIPSEALEALNNMMPSFNENA